MNISSSGIPRIPAQWVLVLGLVIAMCEMAAAKGLPKKIAWTAYGTTSIGYAQSVAIGNALSEKGYKLRVLPAKNDISRMVPLRSGRVHFSATGIGSYLAQEGVLEFGAPKWGPQPVRMIMAAWGDTNTGVVATAEDAGILRASDMRGKRIALVKGAPAINQNMVAWLAFGGLDWDDVTVVEVGGWKASIQGVINGSIDGAIASTNSSMLHQVAGSPRGLRFFPLPHDDKAGWERLTKEAPWYTPHIATEGVGLSEAHPLEGASYGYPILIAYAKQDADAVYELTRLLDETFPRYKDAASGASGWAMGNQVFDWIVPYHEGAVRYFREVGVWSDPLDAHNRALIQRQRVLIDAWKAARSKKSGGSDFRQVWMNERGTALKAAGMDPVWAK